MNKLIRGAQLPPIPSNDVQPECIKVTKVYDWTIVSSAIEQPVIPPQDCLDRIRGIKNLQVECCPNSNPLPTGDKAQICSIKRNIPGLPESAAIVTIRCIVKNKLLFFDGDNPHCFGGEAICCVVGEVPVLIRDVVLCLPEPLDGDNITCGVLSCEGCGFLMDDVVELDLTLCMDIQVELDVKLEVLGKFCQPRLPITPPVTATCPIDITFPPQCNLFPKPNCTCQAAITKTSPDTITTESGSVLGTSIINASICPNCTLDQSSLSFQFTEMPVYPPANEGFTFTANQGSFTQPICDFATPGTSTIMTTGSGTVVLENDTLIQNVNFMFNVVESGNCSYTIVFTHPEFNVSTTVSTATDPSLCTGINIQDCKTLGEI